MKYRNFVGMFYFIFDLGRNVNLDKIADEVASGYSDLSWTLRKDKPSRRFYNPNYLDAIPHFLEIEMKPIVMKMIDIKSWKDISQRRDSTISSSLYSKLIADGTLTSLSDVNMHQVARIYPNGVAVLRLEVDFIGKFDTDHIVGMMNGLMDFDGKMFTSTGNVLSLRDLFESTKEELVKVSNAKSFLKSPDTYTVILLQEVISSPKKLSPTDPEIYALSIRRIEDWRRISLDIAGKAQKNIGFRTGEIAIISSKNALLYLPDLARELIEDLYLRGIECLRAMNVLFQYYDLLLTNVIEEFPDISTDIAHEELEMNVMQLESLRMEIMKSMDAFRRFTTATSFRVKYVFQTIFKAFGLSEILEALREKLENVDAILAAAYQVRSSVEERRTRRLLQVLNILVAVAFSGFVFQALNAFAGGLSFRFVYQEFVLYASIIAIAVVVILVVYFLHKRKALQIRLSRGSNKQKRLLDEIDEGSD